MSLKFYLPNFEDMIDPDYNFVNDQPSPHRRNRWTHDRFAHEFFPAPIFDGMLVSKASLNPSTEERVRRVGGMRNFTRLNPSLPIMGDCGAFTFLLEEKPVYTIQQVIDYYQGLGINYGVSLDHLAFITIEMLENAYEQGKLKERWWQNKTTNQIQTERFELTLANAREFLELHARQKPDFTPIGIAQGGTPELYYTAVECLINMGYEHLALGGLIRSKDREIIAILKAINPLIKNGIQLHIFGVARLSLIPYFLHFGVTSADSSGPLRRAFLGTGEDNYWALDGQKYAAIRIPEVRGNRNKRGVDSVKEVLGKNEDLSTESLVELEQKALNLLRAYDKGSVSLEETLETVLTYDKLYGDKRNHETAYRRTLTDKPWQQCDCSICRSVGVEVIIFRGNNRNRRRGFHNVKVFYEQFQQAIGNPVQIDMPSEQQLHLQF